ncbi:MarR family winged helix-turn-helix transcriptional regulator [Agromyces sp. M3QZ16-3]|uniref:MarR family winged helix-turn-helix transcriptional regulator n=1 Tax=Agromyces sp. M3QZ16-3 TaxID=3447585 RepID=UPI003F690EB0
MNTDDRFQDHDHDHDHDGPGHADGANEAPQASDAPETPTRGIRPLGFWLTTVDQRIAAEVDTALAEEGVGLRDWRRLNLVAGEVRDERLAARLAARPRKLDDLVERGWITGEPGDWTLTDAGRETLDRLTELVQGVRDRVRSAVSDEEYATMIASLEAIARGLGWDESTPEPRRGRGRRRPGFGPGGPGGPGFGPAPWMRRGGARGGIPPWAVGGPQGGPMRHPSAFDDHHGHDVDPCEHEHGGRRHGRGRRRGHGRAHDDVHVHVHLHHDGGRRGGRDGHPEH